MCQAVLMQAICNKIQFSMRVEHCFREDLWQESFGIDPKRMLSQIEWELVRLEELALQIEGELYHLCI